ncbi:polysaccharide pyruvyl transferase family protein [Photobacterium damselae]|uniref:polysaccharide pyruvyl transferase family protein n=1 Tax=Photobacterium damselae TaxID=38293 RepID=UPI000E05678F|nr:polysaccharide pyruvyl transferase family protein [Photobacterium damselae]SUB65678.1 Exopolysaccharide biosynthesis protein [Photobacterium damselae]
MKVLVRGAYGSFNFGDDLLLILITSILKDLHCNVDILCSKQKYISKLIDNQARINDGTLYEEYDLLVYGGGTQFYSFFYEEKNKDKIISFIKRTYDLIINPLRIKGAIMRRLHNTPYRCNNLMYIGIGVGPFYNEDSKKEILKKIDNNHLLLVRDQTSKSYLDEFNIKSILCPDLCFTPYIKTYLPVPSDINIIKKIAIILRDWEYSEDLSPDRVLDIYSQFVDCGYEISFVLFSKISDRKWFQKLNKKVDLHIWDPEQNTINEFINVINGFDLIISSRFHGLVISSILNKPFIGLNIEPKIEIFCKKYNFNNIINPNFNTEEIFDKIEKINNNLFDVLSNIKTVNDIEFSKGDVMLDLIKESI